jgi:hypothetical protein
MLKIADLLDCKRIITDSDVSKEIINEFKARKAPEIIY